MCVYTGTNNKSVRFDEAAFSKLNVLLWFI